MAKQKAGLPAAAGVQVWQSRPTPAQKRQRQGRRQRRSQRSRDASLQDLLKLLVPVVTFVAMAAPEDDDGEGETKKGSA